MSNFTPKAPRGKKTDGSRAESVFADQVDAFDPAELIAQFSRENAGAVLIALLSHAGSNAKAACWLAANIFGEGGWPADVPALVGSATSPKAYAAARDRAMDAFVSGKIDAPAVGKILSVLDDRQKDLAQPMPQVIHAKAAA